VPLNNKLGFPAADWAVGSADDAVAGRQLFFKLSLVIRFLPRWCECRSQLAQVRRPPTLAQSWAIDLRRLLAVFELALLGHLFLSQR